MSITANRRFLQNITYVPVEDIVPGQMQSRRSFSREGLEELRDSIVRYGILQPLTVRQKGERFELIAGERRLRAARMAGLDEVPCIVMDVDMERSGIIALIENIQRRDLNFIEEAEGIYQLIRLFGLTREQAAGCLGKSQSAIANKLRLLRLPESVLERLRTEGLSERHARALLRLESGEQQARALDFIIDQRMSVAAAEDYIERLCCPPEYPPQPLPAAQTGRSIFVMKDARLFLNTLERSLEMLRSAGIDAALTRTESETELRLTVSIPKSRD
ncbi:MAG: ParB/RepB/Spo0J family partition protein [Ruminococcaceae bacterium]|nr:ParB/RepB/Spo0J family partition protein [Oscillospiraceae bacterium]